MDGSVVVFGLRRMTEKMSAQNDPDVILMRLNELERANRRMAHELERLAIKYPADEYKSITRVLRGEDPEGTAAAD